MNIDQLFQTIEQSESLDQLTFPQSWAQGRTAFGGLSASLAFVAMRKFVSAERLTRSLSVQFVGPLLADLAFAIDVEVLREGKSSSMLLAKVIQSGQVCLTLQACFAKDRDSAIVVTPEREVPFSVVDTEKTAPFIKGVTPDFTQHFSVNVQVGQLPFTASEQATLGGWLKFKTAPTAISDAHIVALIDAWPPATLQMTPKPSPASSMTWNIDFIKPNAELAATGWLGYLCETTASSNGYAHTQARVFDQSGELIATSNQSVTVFA